MDDSAGAACGFVVVIEPTKTTNRSSEEGRRLCLSPLLRPNVAPRLWWDPLAVLLRGRKGEVW